MADTIFKKIKFDHNGGSLTFDFNFNGLISLVYSYVLFDSDKRTRIVTSGAIDKDDSNINSFTVPRSLDIASNIERVLQLSCSFTGHDAKRSKRYSIKVKLIQDGQNKGEAEDKGGIDGNLQNSLIIITLK